MNQSANTTCTMPPRAEVIASLNDQLRKTGTGGTIITTQSVRRLAGFNVEALAAALSNYSDFDAQNDPHGERDFGDLSLLGCDLLWKIDYYDLDLQFGSDDPADPGVTHRVLTVLLASEW